MHEMMNNTTAIRLQILEYGKAEMSCLGDKGTYPKWGRDSSVDLLLQILCSSYSGVK